MTQTDPLKIGPGRSVGYALGRFPWPDKAVTRVTLNVLVPHDIRQSVADAGHRIRRWLKTTEARGHIDLGRVLVRVKDPDQLLHEARRDIERRTTESDYVDISAARVMLDKVLIPRTPSSALKAWYIRELVMLAEAADALRL